MSNENKALSAEEDRAQKALINNCDSIIVWSQNRTRSVLLAMKEFAAPLTSQITHLEGMVRQANEQNENLIKQMGELKEENERIKKQNTDFLMTLEDQDIRNAACDQKSERLLEAATELNRCLDIEWNKAIWNRFKESGAKHICAAQKKLGESLTAYEGKNTETKND